MATHDQLVGHPKAVDDLLDDGTLRSLDELVAEADAADVTGWDFSWLDGRGTEERSPWGYARLVAQRLRQPSVAAALDIDTGGGE